MVVEPVSDEYIFDCPECSAEMDVDGNIRTLILEDGCVLCEAGVEEDRFSRL